MAPTQQQAEQPAAFMKPSGKPMKPSPSLCFDILAEEDGEKRLEKLKQLPLGAKGNVYGISDGSFNARYGGEAEAAQASAADDEGAAQASALNGAGPVPPPAVTLSPEDILGELLGDLYTPISQLTELSRLGEGGFAVVHKCRLKTATGEELVAVKKLKPEVIQGSFDLKEFLLEANLLRKLHHLHIVRLRGVGASDLSDLVAMRRSMYVVQELMEGGSLKDMVVLQMAAPFQLVYRRTHAIHWLIQLAEAMNYLHNVCKPMIIHRDLKLENVLMTAGPHDKCQAKLADFGLHKRVARLRSGELKSYSNDFSHRTRGTDNEASYYGGNLFGSITGTLTTSAAALPAALAAPNAPPNTPANFAVHPSWPTSTASTRRLDTTSTGSTAATGTSGRRLDTTSSSSAAAAAPAGEAASATDRSSPVSGEAQLGGSGRGQLGGSGRGSQSPHNSQSPRSSAGGSAHGSLFGMNLRQLAAEVPDESPAADAAATGEEVQPVKTDESIRPPRTGRSSIDRGSSVLPALPPGVVAGGSVHKAAEAAHALATAAPSPPAPPPTGKSERYTRSTERERAKLPNRVETSKWPGSGGESRASLVGKEGGYRTRGSSAAAAALGIDLMAAPDERPETPLAAPIVAGAQKVHRQRDGPLDHAGIPSADEDHPILLAMLPDPKSGEGSGHGGGSTHHKRLGATNVQDLALLAEATRGAKDESLHRKAAAIALLRGTDTGNEPAARSVPVEDGAVAKRRESTSRVPQAMEGMVPIAALQHKSSGLAVVPELSPAQDGLSKLSPPGKSPGASLQGLKSKGLASLEPQHDATIDATTKVGSLLYMAPEVIKGEPYNEKVDVFSFSIIMYEVVTGMQLLMRVGMAGSTELTEYAQAVAEGRREPLPNYWPQEVRSLITACWAQDPNLRPNFKTILTRLQEIRDRNIMDEIDKLKSGKNYSPLGDCGCSIM